jgi:serine/threonine-protein phosphatase 5
VCKKCDSCRFGAAELDCSVALTLDPLYTKAYLRRASARLGLKKYTEAKLDFEKVLQLEPQNKKAKSDLELIEKVNVS